MLGPIFVALTQTAIEKGGRAGITVATGVWTSDFLVIGFAYFFIRQISALVKDQVFHHWVGLIGGFILITFGIAMVLKKAKDIQQGGSYSAKNYVGFWLKGFLVNTVNPFTFVFWFSTISTYVIGKKIDGTEAFVFLGAIMLTIIVTDTLKVLLAKAIRERLNSKHIQYISRIAGAALVIIGLVMLVRAS